MTNGVQKENINLTEIIDLNMLQKFQDTFATSMNVASLTFDCNVAVTRPSNFNDFCSKYTRGSKLGCKRCNKCDVTWSKVAAEKGEPVIYNCHAGLTDFAVPIMLNGIHIGSIFGGQVLTQNPDEKHFKKLAREFGIDENEYLEAIRKVKVIPFEQVEAAAKLLFVVANSISEMAHKNYELIKKSRQEKFLNKIVGTIRDTLDIDKILAFICKEMAKLFNVQRVMVAEFTNPKTCADFKIQKEYKTRTSIEGLDFENTDKLTAKYLSESLFYASDALAFGNIEESDAPDYFKASYKNIGVKSIIGSTIQKGNGKWGFIILSDYDKQRIWTDDEMNFIKMVTIQIYISIQQAELYLANKKQTEREILLRTIIETIRSSLDMDKTLKFICEEAAKLLNVQRATIVQFPDQNNYEIYKIRTEYKNSLYVKGLTSSEYTSKAAEYWGRNLAMSKEILAFDNIQESDTPDYFKQCYSDLGVKSMIGFSIKNDENQWGSLVLSEYNGYRHWSEAEINLLKTISTQVYIAIEQSELYNAVQKTAENEKALRKIMSSSVNNFDLKEVINSIVTETCQLFGADRCLFIEYKPKNNEGEILQSYTECLSSEDIIPASINAPANSTVESLIKNFKNRKILKSSNVAKEKLLEKTKRLLIDVLSVKSYLIVPVYFGDTDYGAIILHYVKDYREFSREEIDLIKAIANQSAAVIHHSKLYKQIEKNEKYTRTVLNGINDCIITIDDDFIIETCNPAVEVIWGYSSSECIGEALSLLLNYDCVGQKKAECLTQKSVYGTKKNGESFDVEVNLSKVVTDDKKVILLVVRDITERKRMEQMKNEFVSTVSHELRTPLTSLRGSLGLIISGKMGDLSEKMKSLLDIANNNCTRLINLINDILDIEKIEAGKMDFIMNTFELMPLINQAIQLNLQFAQKFDVKISLIKSLDNAIVQVDSNRLIQVLTNLLSNAIKFSNVNSCVHLSFARIDENIRVSITNYGEEIPLIFQNRIFQKFAQADSSDSRQKGGTGLGLSISKAIIEKMDGNIGFTSENKKTTFYFDLPEILEPIKETKTNE